MIQYIIVSCDFDVVIWYPYGDYNDIVRYYNIADILHTHEAIQDHVTLAVF